MPSDNIYAIATAAAKKAGYSDFDEGSDGEKKREEIVLALKRRGMKKATYGANNDQARKTGQRTSVERKPRLNPNKLGVSDILNKARKDNPRKKPNIVAQGRENDLYPTGTQFAAGAKDKSPVKKRFANEEEDNEHQLGVRRRDGETDKLSSPAGSIIQAEQVAMEKGLRDAARNAVSGYRKRKKESDEANTLQADKYYREEGMPSGLRSVDKLRRERVGEVSKAILKQGLLDTLLQKKDDDWPHKNLTREQAERIARSRGLRSASDVTQTYIDEEEELEGDAQARRRSKKNTRRRKARKAHKSTTTVEDTIPSPEEKTQSQLEFDDDVSEDAGDIHGGTVPYAPSSQRGGSKRGSKAQKLIPPGDWKPDLQNAVTKNVKFTERTIKDSRRSDLEPVGSSETRQNTIPRGNKSPSQRGPWTARQPRPDKYKNIDRATVRKAREQGDGKGVDPTGKDPLRGRANKNNERFVNADMGVMSYMAKDYDGDREARIKATKDHFQHLLLKTPCVCEQRGVIMTIGMKKGIGDIARSVGAGVKGAVQGAKQGIQDATSNKPMPTVAWPKGGDAGSQSIGLDPASQTKFKKIRSQVNRDIAGRAAAGDPKAQAARRVQDSVASKRIGVTQEARARQKQPESSVGMQNIMRRVRKKMMKSGNGSPLASAEKPVAVMAAEQSGMYSVDGKNLDIDPMANKAPMESVNQTDAATRKASINIDSRGRNTYIQLEDEPSEGDASQVITGLRKPEKQPKLNRQQRRAAEGKGTKNRPRRSDPGRNPGKNPGRKGQTGTKFGVRKSEPTICSSKEVFNSILEKTYYDDQVLERYKDAEKGKTKAKSKSRHITNDITDTAGQQTNKTRGI